MNCWEFCKVITLAGVWQEMIGQSDSQVTRVAKETFLQNYTFRAGVAMSIVTFNDGDLLIAALKMADI